MYLHGLPWWLRQWRICLQCGAPGFDYWLGKILWSREWQLACQWQVFLPGESHGQSSLAGYRPWGCKEPDMTEWLKHTHTLEHTHTHTHTHTRTCTNSKNQSWNLVYYFFYSFIYLFFPFIFISWREIGFIEAQNTIFQGITYFSILQDYISSLD